MTPTGMPATLVKEGKPPCAHAVIDETQDFGPQALRLIRALVPPGPNDLLFVGDGHQRIYAKNRATMSTCGIDIRGRSSKLYLNYRTTEEIRREAVALLEGIEADDLGAFIRQALEAGPTAKIGVMTTTTRWRDQLAKHLREAGYRVATVEHRERLSRKDAQLFAMTLHRAKGLEFDAVWILVPGGPDDRLRQLLYVGMTRAKRMAQLYVLGE